MEVTSKKIIKVSLHMNYLEARWLRDYMRNYKGPSPRSEGIDQRQYRETVFNILDEELEGT